jgi:hypothetical protein
VSVVGCTLSPSASPSPALPTGYGPISPVGDTVAESYESLKGRLGAHAKWARTDPVQGTAAARAKFLQRFLDEVDPKRELPEAERLRRAEHAKSAYFLGLALKSAKARRRAS